MADNDDSGAEANESEAKLVFVKTTGQFVRHDESGDTFVSSALQESADEPIDQDQ